MAKDETYKRLINTSRWQSLRRAVLTAHPVCERCEAEGYVTPACEVHHRVPVESAVTPREKEQLMFDPANLEALCHECHVIRHTEMGRSGREATRKRNDEQTRAVVQRFFQRPGLDGLFQALGIWADIGPAARRFPAKVQTDLPLRGSDHPDQLPLGLHLAAAQALSHRYFLFHGHRLLSFQMRNGVSHLSCSH